MSCFKTILEKYLDEIESKQSSGMLLEYEKKLARNISELSTTKNFFQLEIDKIISVVSKVNFIEVDDPITIIANIIENTIEYHNEQSILLLNSINCSDLEINEKDCSRIFQYFNFSDLCIKISSIYNPKDVDFDYDYELSQKEKVIQNLQSEIKNLPNLIVKFCPLDGIPSGFERDLFEACKKGKFSSVRYLLENKKEDKLKRDFFNNTVLHLACRHGQELIVDHGGMLNVKLYY